MKLTDVQAVTQIIFVHYRGSRKAFLPRHILFLLGGFKFFVSASVLVLAWSLCWSVMYFVGHSGGCKVCLFVEVLIRLFDGS